MTKIDTKLRNLVQRELVVFDFDETIVNCNSDTWIHKLAGPEGRLPEHLEFRHGQEWIPHMQSVVACLHQEFKVTEEDYYECLSKMPAVSGMIEPLLMELAKHPDKYHMIILSDSNSFFISSYLKSKSLDNAFMAVITNQAKFCPDTKQLLIKEYQIQDYCNLSARNLCKGEALKNFIGKQMLDNNTVYTCINYVGDGENDLCPSSKLGARDRVFPRDGYSLSRLCAKLKGRGGQSINGGTTQLPDLKATIVPWTTGEDILKAIMAPSGAATKAEQRLPANNQPTTTEI